MFAANFSKSSIQEANRHVQELMKRIKELEGQNKQLESTVEEREQQFQSSLTELSRRFEAEIHETQLQLNDADKQIERLHRICEEKDTVISELRRRVALLDRIVPHASAISEVARIVDRAKRSYETINVGAEPNDAELILVDSEVNGTPKSVSFKHNLAQVVRTSSVSAADKFSIDDASAEDDS